ncbi:DEAD/DEAH box helicase [Clostridium celatum]|uniref:DEAD/DEAH box helicase n=1 Tax=Clostridium celatum TaxID=36834 RepID=UPI00290BB92B|nr:DEAD/DEAH box helicase [Clostridium celatum]MDU6296188.1 helicase-related protein [Clostridium celatum]
MRGLYSQLIDKVIAKINSDKKTFIFFKGFNEELFKVIGSKNVNRWLDNLYINSDSSINIKKLEENKSLLLISFLQTTSNLTWGYYEELISLCNTLNDIEKQVNARIIIIENNLFNNCYPISINKDVTKRLAKYINNEEKENDELEIYMHYYSDVRAFSNENYGLVYNEKDSDYNFKKINFYDTDIDLNLSKEPAEGIIITDLNLFEFKSNIQRGLVTEDFSLVIDKKEDLNKVKSLIEIANKLDIKYTILCKSRFEDNNGINENKYLPLLKKYWGEDKEFRKMNFYKNPEENNEIIEISQGHIISDIISQSQIALNNNENFRDIFITAPTGAGKSVLFQIPAIYLAKEKNAITIVITPLIALMRDQVEQLNNERGIDFVTFLNSEISFEEKEARIKKIRNGEISIVYMAPELLLGTSLENIVGNRRVGLLVVDEAHIVTTWGRDFRADYWFLGTYIEKMRRSKEKEKNFPIVCLTATAVYMGTEDTVNDTITTLALITPKLYLGNVRRKNIKFDINVIDKNTIVGGFDEFKVNRSYERILRLLAENKKSIVYCPFTRHISDITEKLGNEVGEKVGVYYGAYEKLKKLEAQQKFKSGDHKVMICTKAFGMGIDISDIETVYHYAPTGNLSDYVQEIGRVARDEQIQGYAATDFTTSDLKYIRMLNGLSAIRQYQLKEILRKLYSIYKDKKKRNLLVSPETFSYLFGEDNIENKVKTSLLLLEKDINTQFNVLVVRPKSIFTKNFVNVPTEIEEEFVSKYGSYIKSVDDYSKRVLPGTYKNGDIVIYNNGTIYEVNMSEVWENNFSDLTFPDFKRRFFNGELFKFTNEETKLSARVHLTISYKKEYEECKILLKDYCNKLSSIFAYFKSKNAFFRKNDFKKEFEKRFKGTFVTQDLADIILDMFVADGSKNIGFNKNKDKYKFIQMRKSQTKSMEVEYRVMNGNFSTLGNYLVRQLAQCEPNNSQNVHSSYIAISKGDKKTDVLQLSILLELFALATYEVVGGKNTEIFIRINDPMKIKRLAVSNYRNTILTNIERKRKKSQEVLQYFMRSKLSDDERWDIIENYFLGNEEYVNSKLGIL